MSKKIKIFIGYADEDLYYLENLKAFLTPIFKRYDIKVNYANQKWDNLVQSQINDADILLFILSSDFLASDFIYKIDLDSILERHHKRQVSIIPIIARPCYWQDSMFSNLRVLPSNEHPIIEFTNQDQVFWDVGKGIIAIIDHRKREKIFLKEKKINDEQLVQNKINSKLENVFVVNGIPDVTFVEPEDYQFLKLSLKQQGGGIVIEGSTGIGKTSLTINLLKKEKLEYTYLSARDKRNIPKIKKIETLNGLIVIDDFHRLDYELQIQIADWLKLLADQGNTNTKLLIIGIPNIGSNLIDISFDLTNRISVFKIGIVSDEKIKELIEKGEKALNIEFLEKPIIIRESYGSLQITQLLCQYIAGLNKVSETQEKSKTIENGVYDAITRIMKDLTPKYDDVLKSFASLGEIEDKTSLEILKELAILNTKFLNLNHLKIKKPSLKSGIDKLINSNALKQFFLEKPIRQKHLIFDDKIPGLIIDDPQLRFYLNNISFNELELITGKTKKNKRTKVFISYSHEDEKWVKRILVHLKPLEKKKLIDLWVDSRIYAGQHWKEEIKKALSQTKVAIILLSPDFLASDFIFSTEIPSILKAVENDNAKILQLILRPCSIKNYPELNQFQMINKLDNPFAALSEVEQDRMLVRLGELVDKFIHEE